MSFAEVLKQVKSLSYETIIFDTAPTGHTLRFLQFPTVLEKALAKVSQLSTQFGPMLNGILGANGSLPNGANLPEMMEKLEGLRAQFLKSIHILKTSTSRPSSAYAFQNS